MPRICYKEQNFRKDSLAIIVAANQIIDEMQQQGFTLTLRQLYYQFVAQDILPNTLESYNKLGDLVNRGRLGGYIDWDAIVDRTRSLREITHWESPAQILMAAAEGFCVDTRSDQPHYIEVWVEKDALVDVVAKACKPLDIAYFSCRGYVSQSSMWEAAMRIESRAKGKDAIILHLGDHDPSGIDMSRDIADRLSLFECVVYVRRIALTMEQVVAYAPPPNPAKITDSRSAGYRAEFGDESWELDALPPRVLVDLIENSIESYTDDSLRQNFIDYQTEQQEKLRIVAKNWR